MAKKNKASPGDKRPNPVAKNAWKVNRCIAFKDRRGYKRTAKHKGMEPFPTIVVPVSQ